MSENKGQVFIRFSVARRIEHILLLVTFTLLAITGLPQKFPEAGISDAIIRLFGGIELTRIIHRTNAILMLTLGLVDFIYAGYLLYVSRKKASMLPYFQDAKDALQAFLYNLGIAKTHPKMGRYNFEEKAEYWAMIWGTLIMGLTGFMMWNPIKTTLWLPGESIPAAKAAHGAEAILAVLAIIVWHFYNVHLKEWNWSMINGKMSRHQMEEHHALELGELESEIKQPEPTPEQKKKRSLVYFPVTVVLSLLLVFAVYRFLTVKVYNITTVPPAVDVPAYVRQTSTPLPTQAPTATPAPTSETPAQPAEGAAALTWESGIGKLFDNSCTACHGKLGGFKAGSYADVMKGSDKGPVIKPGDAAGSLLMTVQSAGDHPGQFTAEELAQIKAWIDAGAPEK
jgi:formate dehydrogenase gamma subunit